MAETYQIINERSIRRMEDGACIPTDPQNSDYARVLEWIAEGNALIPADAPVVEVPQTVSRFQAKAALLAAGMLSTVEAMMADPETPAVAKLAWAEALEFNRTSPTVLSMAAALQLTDAQLDELFIAASTITA